MQLIPAATSAYTDLIMDGLAFVVLYQYIIIYFNKWDPNALMC